MYVDTEQEGVNIGIDNKYFHKIKYMAAMTVVSGPMYKKDMYGSWNLIEKLDERELNITDGKKDYMVISYSK